MLMSLSSLTQITIMAVAFFMVVNGSITTGAVVSSVIVSSRMSGIISNLSSTLVALLSAEKTTKDLVSFFETNKEESMPALQSISHPAKHISIMGVSYQYNPQSLR